MNDQPKQPSAGREQSSADAVRIHVQWARHYSKCAAISRRTGTDPSLWLALRARHMTKARVARGTQ